MPEAEEKLVDIDTSGPGAEVELPAEDKTFENEIEVSNETTKNSIESNDSTEKPSEQSDVQASETKEQEKKRPVILKNNESPVFTYSNCHYLCLECKINP